MNNRKKILIGCITLNLFAGTLTAHDINQRHAKFQERKSVLMVQKAMARLLLLQILVNELKDENPSFIKELTQLQQNKAMKQYTMLFEDCLAGSREHCKKILTFIPPADKWKEIQTRADFLFSSNLDSCLYDDFLSKMKANPSLIKKLSLAQSIDELCYFLIAKCDQGIQICDQGIAINSPKSVELAAIDKSISLALSVYLARTYQQFKSSTNEK